MFIPPIDASQVLQPNATKTASFNGAALDLGRRYGPGGLGKIIAGVVTVTAIDLTSGNETYALKLQQSADNATWEDIGMSVPITAIGTAVVKGIITSRYLRLVLTAAGTTPSLTYAANVGMS